ncbi:MAG: calcium/sodium antiporter [Patescibacteria group bacterium]
MTLFIPIFLFGLAMVMLTFASDYLVKGSSSIAKQLNIPQLVIGLTIVAFGTSAPEFVISIFSALQGNTEVALGNIIGSNIFNILGILGICSLIFPLTVNRSTIKQEIPYSLFAAILVPSLVLIGNNKKVDFFDKTNILGFLNYGSGLVLLFFFVLFLIYVYLLSNKDGLESEEVKIYPTPISICFILLGLAGLSLGAKIAVENAILLGSALGLSSKIIGLTIVAIGTSLPELFASIAASLNKNSDLAIGNIIGSNIFNIFLILGATSIVKPIPFSGSNLLDNVILILTTLLLIGLIIMPANGRLRKIEGSIMILAYLTYTVFLITTQ